MKRIALALAAGFAALLASACLPAASSFQVLDTGSAPFPPPGSFPQVPSAHSRLVSNRIVDLVWRPGSASNNYGTSLESDDLGIEVEAGDTLTVNYGLSSSTPDFVNTMPAGASIRIFAYYRDSHSYMPGNRPNVAPTACGVNHLENPEQAAAAPVGQRTGTLSCTIQEAGVLGYTGLVYDVSNSGVQGRVRFSDLKLNDELILLN